jgi:hypothetical protein
MSILTRRSLFAALAAAPITNPSEKSPTISIAADQAICACGWPMWRQLLDKDKGHLPSNLGITCGNKRCKSFGKVFEMPTVPGRQIPGVKSELA